MDTHIHNKYNLFFNCILHCLIIVNYNFIILYKNGRQKFENENDVVSVRNQINDKEITDVNKIKYSELDDPENDIKTDEKNSENSNKENIENNNSEPINTNLIDNKNFPPNKEISKYI